jgi:hypothetical protein
MHPIQAYLASPQEAKTSTTSLLLEVAEVVEDFMQSQTECLTQVVAEVIWVEEALLEVYLEMKKTVMMIMLLATFVAPKARQMSDIAMDVMQILVFLRKTRLTQSSVILETITLDICLQLKNNQFSLLKLMEITNTVFQKKRFVSLLRQGIDLFSVQVEVLMPCRSYLNFLKCPLKIMLYNGGFKLLRPCFKM